MEEIAQWMKTFQETSHVVVQKDSLAIFVNIDKIMCVPPTLVSIKEPVHQIKTHWVLNAAALQGILDLIVALKEAIRVQIRITLNLAEMAETVRSRILPWDTHANAHRSILGLNATF